MSEVIFIISTRYLQLKSLECKTMQNKTQISESSTEQRAIPDVFHRGRRQCGLAAQENDRLLGPAHQLYALLDLRERVNDQTELTHYK